VLAGRLRAEYRGENLGVAPSRKMEQRRSGAWILDGSGPIAAVMEKELRTLLRTLPLLYAIGAPLLMMIIFSSAFLRGSGSGAGHVFAFALPIAVAYALLGFSQMFYNNLGAEGPGIQVYFLSPTPIRTVLLAKNLFHCALCALMALVAGTLTSLRLGIPDGAMATATAAWLLFALPTNLAAGDVLSLTMAYRVNPGRISRQRGSQANAILSLLIQLGVIGSGAVVFLLSWYWDNVWLAVPVFLTLGAGAAFAWMRVLRNADRIANQRRDSLIATLMKTE
jgi:ABC-2 type transport system permease protein